MNAFQIVVVSLLGGLFARELFTFRWSGAGMRIARATIWLIGALLVLRPDFAQLAANAAGIGRGTDMVLYCGCLATTAGFFYIYSQQITLERRLTELVRRQALADARFGGESN